MNECARSSNAKSGSERSGPQPRRRSIEISNSRELGWRLWRTRLSLTLRIKYRTSRQIRTGPDRLLGPELSDVDGIIETRRGPTSTFNGHLPTILIAATEEDEGKCAQDWLAAPSKEGVVPGEIGLFVRSAAQFPRARAALELAGIPYTVLDEQLATNSATASLCSMHLAKGLEFRPFAVIACDDGVIPLKARIEAAGDESDLEEIYSSERNLLYVACTLAHDHLLVTGVKPASEFLDDLRP